MPRPLPSDPVAYRNARAWALAATLVVVFYAFRLVRRIVILQGSPNDTGKWAIVPFLMLGLIVVVAWFGLGHLWRRARALRPPAHPVAPDALPGAAAGLPELDEPSGRHLTFDSPDEPPRRW